MELQLALPLPRIALAPPQRVLCAIAQFHCDPHFLRLALPLPRIAIGFATAPWAIALKRALRAIS